jgi:hypothetical protein
VAGQDGAVICSTAVGFSLHPSGPGGMTSAIVTLSEHPAWGLMGVRFEPPASISVGAMRVVYISGRSLLDVKARRRL